MEPLLPAQDLPQIRHLRIRLADPGAAGRSRPCPVLSWRRRELGRAPQLELSGRGHLGQRSPCVAFYQSSTACTDTQAGGRVRPISHSEQTLGISELLTPSPVLHALGTSSLRFAL